MANRIKYCFSLSSKSDKVKCVTNHFIINKQHYDDIDDICIILKSRKPMNQTALLWCTEK